MISELGRRPMFGGNVNAFGDELEKDIGLLLREQRREDYDYREKELNIYRSGSAPPTVEGSLSAVGGLFGYGVSGDSGYSQFAPNKGSNGFMSEEELRSDPSYLSYYYSNVNLNPRLPPPLLSKEDWRFAKRLQGGSSAIGDRRKVNRNDSGGTGTLLSMPPGFSSKKQDIDNGSVEVPGSVEWGGDGLIGLPALELGSKQKNLAEIFQGQDDLTRTIPVSKAPSRPASRNALDQSINDLGPAESDMASLHADLTSNDPLRSSSNILNSSAQLGGQPASYGYAAAPDPQAFARSPSPGLPLIGGGRAGSAEKRNIASPNPGNGLSHLTNDSVELVASLSGMSLENGVGHEESHFPARIEQDIDDRNSYLFNMPTNQNNSKQHFLKADSGATGNSMLQSDINHALQGDHRKATVRNNAYRKGSSASVINGPGGPASQYQQLDNPNSLLSGYNLGGYPVNPLNLPPLFENAAAASAMGFPGMDARMLGASSMSSPASAQNLRMGNQMNAGGLQSPYMDPAYIQYLSTSDYLGQVAALNDPSVDRNRMGNLYADLLQKAYLNGMLSPQKASFVVPAGTKHAGANHPSYYGNPAFGLAYAGSPLASPLFPNSPAGHGSPMRHADFGMRYTSGMKYAAGGVLGPWHIDSLDKSYGSTLLEEFKSNTTKCFELTGIAGHVVEFSADQYGSRFIQQKLETASTEEKSMVFDEINPHALTLMTDVFGNYVIQKLFEHGMSSQRRELARKLMGNVLAMSLQMYGCRVIQKALEVVDEDQKIQMVKELDGHIMHCVRDQNGNHVIQKCIECIPEDHIQFIVSTCIGQVVTLSTHPYGCRVIQRVLEHCSDDETQSKVMKEILGSISMLAQDQYGNYVIQHVMEHGKPEERSAIIQKLAGKIVEMSQQKFASNVVEKCLTFGDPSDRLLLVNEMLGTTDENEPLQTMMKDQFANYVVQKALETCSDQHRELIVSMIKVHLNALKKYTYGKHIVARVEKLLAAGERRIAASLAANPA